MELMLATVAGIEFVLLVAVIVYFVFVKKETEEKKEVIQLKNALNFIMGRIKGYLLLLDEENRIIMCSNSLVKEVEEDSQESLRGANIFDLKSSKISSEISRDINNELKKNGVLDKVYEFKRENADSLWLDVKSSSLTHEGEFLGNLIFCTDITSEMKGKEELLSLVHLREQLLMSISHELRTPLNAISGSADMLCLSKNIGENEKNHVLNIKEAYRTLAHRVNEITEYSNIKNEKLVIENREFVLQEIFDSIRNAVYVRAYEKGIGFWIDVSPQIPAKLYGDVTKISNVLLTLLFNRIEDTERGYIKLAIHPVYREEKLFLKYEVSDTGHGMDYNDIRQLLEPEGLEELKGDTEGKVAIGFTIGREYIRAMGGELQGESTYNNGTRLWFELEAKVMSEEKSAKVQYLEEKSVIFCAGTEWKKSHISTMLGELGLKKYEEYKETKDLTESVWSHIIIDSSLPEASEILKLSLPYPCKKILILETSRMVIDGFQEADIILYEPFHIFMLAEVLNQMEHIKKQFSEEELIFKTKGIKALVVDDNDVNRMVCRNILKQFEIETDEADSGDMAVQKYYANDYDFIFMDYLMPGLDGAEATKKIRSILKEGLAPVIIALSANVTNDIRQQFEAAGAEEVMAKPLELAALSEVLRKWLNKERIVENAEKKREKEEMLSEEALYSVLREVKGLEVETGLSHVLNSAESYIKVLRICSSNVGEQLEHIKAGHNLVAAVDLRINFHSLKGVFANVGAVKLAERSKELELAAAQNDGAFVNERVGEYIEAVERFVKELDIALNLYKDILNATTEENEIYEPIAPEEYKALIEQAKEAVRQYEFTEITNILERLIKASKGKNRELIEKALEEIGEFRYDSVFALLEELA